MTKFIFKTSLLSLSAALLLTMSGCSGGGSGSDAVSGAFGGIGIDGILMQSTVCIDADKSGTCDAGEITALTDNDGKFSFPAGTASGPLLLSGGTDKSTGETFKGVLKAPAGSSVVTPLTSAIQSLMDNNSSVSAADAEATIKTAMGLTDVGVPLTSFDPYNGLDGNDSIAAKLILAKQTQLQILVHTAAATIAGADANTDINSTMSNVFDAIVTSMDTGAEVELDAQAVAIATREAAAKTYPNDDALVVAVGTVAQAEAEDAVSAANGAEKAIREGDATDAIGTLDGAINAVNSEDGNATGTAVNNQSALTSTQLENIIDARKKEDSAAKLAAQKEAEAVAARAKADKALLDAENKDELEAAERLRAEAAAAEQLAAQKSKLEAEAAEEKAAAELAASLINQAEKDAQVAAAQAEKDAQVAAALQAEIEEEAALEAAEALKEAEEADLEALKEEAERSALAAEQLRATELIASYIITANNYANNAQVSADSVQVLKDAFYAVDSNLSVATSAADEAMRIARDLNSSSETNTTVALEKKDSVVAQAKIAADALKSAQEIKGAKDIADAIRQGQDDRIAIILTDVNTTKIIAQNLLDQNATDLKSQVTSQLHSIEVIAGEYADAMVKFNEANASAQVALKAYNDTNKSLELIKESYADIETASTDRNETAAIAAQEIADAEKAKIDGYLQTATSEAGKIAAFLVSAQAIQVEADADEAERVAAAINASKIAAQTSLNTAVQAANDANASAQTAQTNATAVGVIASSNSNAYTFVATASGNASSAGVYANEAQIAAELAASKMRAVFVTNVATITETSAASAASLIASYTESAVSMADEAAVSARLVAAALLSAQNAPLPDPLDAYSVNVAKLKADTTALITSPSNVADVADAKNMFAQLRETAVTFVDLENVKGNSSTLIGTEADLLKSKIEPAAEAIAEDFNTTVTALENSTQAFMDSFDADFAAVLGTDTTHETFGGRLEALSNEIESHEDETLDWSATVGSDTVAYTYAEDNITKVITQTFTLNGETITAQRDGTKTDEFDGISVNTTGTISFVGTGYNLNMTAFDFTNNKATFAMNGTMTGANNASMTLTTLSAETTINPTINNLSMFTQITLAFDGEIVAGGRTLSGKLSVSETNSSIEGAYTGLSGEPTFNGKITLNASLNQVMADAEEQDNKAYINSWDPLLMVEYSDGSKSFVMSYTQTNSSSSEQNNTWVNIEDYVFRTQSGVDATCRRTQVYDRTNNSEESNIVCNNGENLLAYYTHGNMITVSFDNGESLPVREIYFYWNGNEYYQHINFNSDGNSEPYNDNGILYWNGVEVTVTNIEVTPITHILDRKFDVKVEGTVVHGSKKITAEVGISRDFETRIFAQNIEITDGTSFVTLTELSAVMTNVAFIEELKEDDYYYNSPSRFENYSYSWNDYYDNESNEFQPESILSAKLDNLQISIVDADSEALRVDANVSLLNRDTVFVGFDGTYTYRDTAFVGHIDVNGTFTENNNSDPEILGTANVFGSVASNGFVPFEITSTVTASANEALDSYTLFKRGSDYELAIRMTHVLTSSANEPKAGTIEVNLGDSNGVLGTYTSDYNDAAQDQAASLNVTNSEGTSLGVYGEDTTGNKWEIVYSDNTSETIF